MMILTDSQIIGVFAALWRSEDMIVIIMAMTDQVGLSYIYVVSM